MKSNKLLELCTPLKKDSKPQTFWSQCDIVTANITVKKVKVLLFHSNMQTWWNAFSTQGTTKASTASPVLPIPQSSICHTPLRSPSFLRKKKQIWTRLYDKLQKLQNVFEFMHPIECYVFWGNRDIILTAQSCVVNKTFREKKHQRCRKVEKPFLSVCHIYIGLTFSLRTSYFSVHTEIH